MLGFGKKNLPEWRRGFPELYDVETLELTDLITVASYDVGGSIVLVPQRIDPERAESGIAIDDGDNP